MAAYGALGASSHNGRPTFPVPGAPADMLLGWALPLLSDVNSNSEAAELALEGLHEFVTAGEASATELYLPSVLRACQALLEDEGTPIRLLRPLLGILTAIASRFTRVFQPHFADLVDLLLGWVLMPDLSESDCFLITESFLQFQNLWAGNFPFSSNLLFKFLGDMEVLAQDTVPETLNQIRRLFALASCFVAVLRATTSGILELGFGNDAVESFEKLLPRLLACLGMVGLKFRAFKWLNEASSCLLLFATVLRGRFSKFYSLATDFLLKSLDLNHNQGGNFKDSTATFPVLAHFPMLTSNQVQMLLKVNLELISLQASNLPANVVAKLLCAEPFSRLRLHPSRGVTGVIMQTYLSLLRHDDGQVVQAATDCLIDELHSLKDYLCKVCNKSDFLGLGENQGRIKLKLSELDLRQLIKFDILGLTCSVHWTSSDQEDKPGSQGEVSIHVSRAKDIRVFLLEKMNPYESPLQFYADIQVVVVQSLHRLFCLGVEKGLSTVSHSTGEISFLGKGARSVALGCLSSCDKVIAKALDVAASFPVKMEALEWLETLSNLVITSCRGSSQPLIVDMYPQDDKNDNGGGTEGCAGVSRDLMSALLIAASDKEQKVRREVAKVLVLLFHARLINPFDMQDVAEVALEHLGDPEPALQKDFLGCIAIIAPASLWTLGYDSGPSVATGMSWKQVFVLRQFSQHLRPQQLVFILNYIAQRWQVLPPSWLQRLIHSFPEEKGDHFSPNYKKGDSASISLGIDTEHLERICASSTVASAWWAVQEAARHCIAVRLRTHLGGPTQTFGALERMLLDVVQSLQEDLNSQRETGNTMVLPGIQLLPMRLLLEFVEALKKNMYNAYEGSVVLPASPPTSVPFFRANRKVCEEWFVRISEALMNASWALRCHAATFHHAILRLQDLRSVAVSALRDTPWPQMTDSHTFNLKLKTQQDVLRTLRVASLALCRAHEADMIVGLQTWATSTFAVLVSDDALSVQNVSSTFGPLGWMSGLVLQAQGQYERATAFFSLLLQSDEALAALGADGVQFIIARTIESYAALADWETLEVWLQELQTLRARHAGKAYAGALTTAGHDMNAIHALACFDSGDVQGAWGHLDLTPQSSSDLTSDPCQALHRSEQMLLQALLREGFDTHDSITKETEKAKSMLEEALLVSGFDGLSQAAPFIMQLHCIKTVEAKIAKHNNKGIQEANQLEGFSPFQQVAHLPLDKYHQDCHLWLKLLRTYRTVFPRSQARCSLQWNLIRLARKQHNFKLSHHLLKEMYNMEFAINGVLRDGLMAREYERTLLQYGEGKHQEAVTSLWCLVQSSVMSCQASSQYKQPVVARACLKLAAWLKKRPLLPAIIFSTQNIELKNELGAGVSISMEEHVKLSELPPDHEEVIGAAVKSATCLDPSISKSWYLYATWCYNHAKLSFSTSYALQKPSLFPQVLDTEFPVNGSTFTPAEAESIQTIILETLNDIGDMMGMRLVVQPKAGPVEAFAQSLLQLMQAAAGTDATENSDGESPSALLVVQLQQELLELGQGALSSLAVVACVNKLMDIWWNLRKRRVSLYGHALRGFLKYLSLSKCKLKGMTSNTRMEGVYYSRKDHVLSCSLYALNIIYGHGVELDDIFCKGVSSVPPEPWQEITPQLFARLTTHPEPHVCRQLEGLLMTLAHLSPSTVVYSTLVNMNTSSGERSPELQRLLSRLVKLHPKMVADVQLLMAELGAITVLWEEQWLSTLQDVHADVVRILASLKEEAARLGEDSTLGSSERMSIMTSSYTAYMAPVIASLERTLLITSRTPETVHESWFQEQYGSQLKAAISGLRCPPTGVSAFSDVWRPFDTIVASLASQVKKSVIPLAHVAPRLAALNTSDVPVPGLLEKLDAITHDGTKMEEASKLSGIVTVAAFSKQVHVLATKTKPKKLTMIGSDGHLYTYLLKGHEDLRLDARIMQLLRAVNGMLFNRASTRGRGGLASRHYSVTPISGRAGLIQWVDNLVSMYAVFKAWQQRNQAVQYASTGISGTTHEPVAAAVPRPSDMFYGKMIPALKERGLRKVFSRRDWPQEVKRKVLLELIKETPRQLLHKELWCASDGFTSFNSKLLRFSRSTAVMSIVGYILGLGDRHLDNILMDFSTGDVVHIDYNVCFDKGLRLKIPEIVPFRLTHTIQAALGLTGIEGTFRCSCEKVLETLRLNKEVILMLLDVFVWDPLIEWTKGDGRDALIVEEERRGLLRVAPSLLVQDTRAPLQASEDIGQSQVARSQDMLASTVLNKEELSLGEDCVKTHFEHISADHGNICESFDEGIISQVENENWISPPHSSGVSSGNSDKQMQDPLESFWLQSPGESLSSPRRVWGESRTMPDQQTSVDAMLDFSTLGIQETNHDTSSQVLQLHSQEGGASFLEVADVAHGDTGGVSIIKGESQKQELSQAPGESAGLAFHTPNNHLTATANGISSSFMDMVESDVQTCSDHIRRKHEFSFHTRRSGGSIYDTVQSFEHTAMPSTALDSLGAAWPSQKKSAYAVSVLKKVELKLDGLDNESRRQLPVPEQVDYLLRQAMSIDNLCNMYEGWTPWI